MLHSSTGLALEGNERWVLVHTLPHNERRAQLHLGAQGFRTFVNFVGTLERLDAAGRVRVLLDMMGTAVPVALRRTAICPAA